MSSTLLSFPATSFPSSGILLCSAFYTLACLVHEFLASSEPPNSTADILYKSLLPRPRASFVFIVLAFGVISPTAFEVVLGLEALLTFLNPVTILFLFSPPISFYRFSRLLRPLFPALCAIFVRGANVNIYFQTGEICPELRRPSE